MVFVCFCLCFFHSHTRDIWKCQGQGSNHRGSLLQCCVLNPLNKAGDGICVLIDTNRVSYPWAMTGSPWAVFNTSRDKLEFLILKDNFLERKFEWTRFCIWIWPDYFWFTTLGSNTWLPGPISEWGGIFVLIEGGWQPRTCMLQRAFGT